MKGYPRSSVVQTFRTKLNALAGLCRQVLPWIAIVIRGFAWTYVRSGDGPGFAG